MASQQRQNGRCCAKPGASATSRRSRTELLSCRSRSHPRSIRKPNRQRPMAGSLCMYCLPESLSHADFLYQRGTNLRRTSVVCIVLALQQFTGQGFVTQCKCHCLKRRPASWLLTLKTYRLSEVLQDGRSLAIRFRVQHHINDDGSCRMFSGHDNK